MKSTMDPWTESYLAALEVKRKEISDSDFRFYSIGRLPLIAGKSLELSNSCELCKKNLNELERIAEMLPQCLKDPIQRKEFDDRKTFIENHLKKIHHIKPAHYHYSLYTLIGIIAGSITGIILSLLFFNTFRPEIPLLSAVAGLFAGQIAGKRRDRRAYRKNQQF